MNSTSICSLLYPSRSVLRRRLKWYLAILLCFCAGYVVYRYGKRISYSIGTFLSGTHLWIANEGLKVGPFCRQEATSIWAPETGVNLFGARGEYLSFQIVISCTTKQTVSINQEAKANKQSSFLQLKVFREHFVRPKHLYRPGTTGEGLYPDPLISIDGKIEAEAYQNLVIWVECKVPRTFIGDSWEGYLNIQIGDKSHILPIRATIWNFSLSETSHLAAYTEMYASRFAKGEGVPYRLNDPDFIYICNEYNEMAMQHRLVLGWRRANPMTTFDTQTGELTKIDWKDYDKLFGPWIKRRPACWRAPIDENWRIGLKSSDGIAIQEYAREIERHFIIKKWPINRTFAYIFDEPLYSQLRQVSEYGRVLHKGSSKLRYLVTASPDPLLQNVDDFAPLASDYFPEEMNGLVKTGCRGWFYQSESEPHLPLEYIDTYGVAFRLWPWIAWKYRVNGIMLWAANFWKDRPYEALDAYYGNGEGLLFYPGSKLPQIGHKAKRQPVPSYRLKMLRKGMEDYEYLWLIEKNLGRDVADSFAQRVVESALCEQYNPKGGYRGYWGSRREYYGPKGSKYAYATEDSRRGGKWEKDPESFERIRREMGELLDKHFRNLNY